MEKRKNGLIKGLSSVRLFPCFWLGLAPPKPNQTYSTKLRGKLRKDSQFFILHAYGGSPCDMVGLQGICLPLTTCDSEDLLHEFRHFQDKYYDHPFNSAKPNLDEISMIRDELSKIGPLDISKSFRDVGEGYFPVHITSDLYAWLREHFEMVTIFSDRNESDSLYSRLEVEETSPLGWRTEVEFARWFFSDNSAWSESALNVMLSCAFIYPNSDNCDNFGFENLQYPVGVE
ncbi:MAG: hypothetical protein IPJ90_09930 [Anaerolineaceae bacterium]|nr:hypothetical protein [Anaerolineaceae bacterium]